MTTSIPNRRHPEVDFARALGPPPSGRSGRRFKLFGRWPQLKGTSSSEAMFFFTLKKETCFYMVFTMCFAFLLANERVSSIYFKQT